MTITRQQRYRFASVLLLLSFAMIQDIARPGQPCFTFHRFEQFRFRQFWARFTAAG